MAKIGFQKNNNRSPVRLAERRRKQLILRLQLLLALVVVIVGALSYFSQYPTLVIRAVEVSGIEGVEQKAVEGYVADQLSGKYAHLFAKRNFLLYPKHEIEVGILDQFKKIKKVAIKLRDRNTLLVYVETRTPVAAWCSETLNNTASSTEANATTSCVALDSEGLAFEPIDATSTLLMLKKPFDRESVIGERVLDTRFAQLEQLVTDLSGMNYKPNTIQFRDNGDFEVLTDQGMFIFGTNDDLKASVANLKLLLNSAEFKSQFATSSKQIDYVDLRFGKKLFFKLK